MRENVRYLQTADVGPLGHGGANGFLYREDVKFFTLEEREEKKLEKAAKLAGAPVRVESVEKVVRAYESTPSLFDKKGEPKTGGARFVEIKKL